MPRRPNAFTLVELLVVIGIIALLVSILLPTLAKARESAVKIKCLSNLRTVGNAITMYVNNSRGFLPFPTGTQGEDVIWFNAIDKYLQTTGKQANARTGVAANRNYKAHKQCPVYESFEGDLITGSQGAGKEFSKSYKMNSHMRRNTTQHLNVAHIKETPRVILVGDSISLDITGPIDNQWENGQFSFEVNDPTQAGPALRHGKAANILFVDGHAESVKLPTITKTLRSPQNNIVVQSWEGEYVNAAGTPTEPTDRTRTAEAQGLKRNPNMPLIWSNLGRFYR